MANDTTGHAPGHTATISAKPDYNDYRDAAYIQRQRMLRQLEALLNQERQNKN
jgi:hypothetical protein